MLNQLHSHALHRDSVRHVLLQTSYGALVQFYHRRGAFAGRMDSNRGGGGVDLAAWEGTPLNNLIHLFLLPGFTAGRYSVHTSCNRALISFIHRLHAHLKAVLSLSIDGFLAGLLQESMPLPTMPKTLVFTVFASLHNILCKAMEQDAFSQVYKDAKPNNFDFYKNVAHPSKF